MLKIKRLSSISTVICIISMIVYIAASVWLFSAPSDSLFKFAGDSMEKLESLNGDNPAAGFMLFAYLAGGALGLLGGIFVLFIALFLLLLALYQLPEIITGLFANGRYKKNADKEKCLKAYKTDGFVKAIMSGLILVLAVFFVVGNVSDLSVRGILEGPLLLGNYIIVFVLSVIQIKLTSFERDRDLIKGDML